MKALKILLLSIVLVACSDGTFWNDGNYTVYRCCGQHFFALGYEINGNGWEGLIDHVDSVGSNQDYVVVRANSKYFIVEKVKNNEHWNNRKLISLALSESAFISHKARLNLPDFTHEFD